MASSSQTTASAAPIAAYKTLFLQSCISAEVLKFGTFTLKSGRSTYASSRISIHSDFIYMTNHLIESPYFFNAGSFHTSALLSAIAAAYAHTIISFLAANPTIPKPDVIFGYEPREDSFSSSNKPLTRDLADQLIKESHLLLQH